MTEPPMAAPAPLLHPAVLQDIMRSLASATLRPDIFGAVLEPTRKLFGAASVLAFLTHPGIPEPALAAACGEPGHRTLGLNPACLEHAAGGADPRLVWGQELTGALPGADRLAVPLPASILVPLVQEDHALGMLVVNLQERRAPGPQEHQLLQFLALQCVIALGRAEATEHLERQIEQRTRQLQEKADALEMQTRVLEGFAQFSQNLSTLSDREAVVRRAQEIMLSLLPEGYSVYWEPERGVWKKKVQVGTLPAPVQQLADEGRPAGSWPAADRVWQTGEPLYQADADPQPEIDSHIRASVTLPVLTFGEPCGVLRVGLTGETDGWSNTQRILLETLARHLGLVLEGVQRSEVLKQQALELQRSNQELERFAYIASHDLQEPLRTITSFAQLMARKYGSASSRTLDARADQYLTIIEQGSERMRALIDDLLAYSKLDVRPRELKPVESREPLLDALERLDGHIRSSDAQIIYDPGALPTVLGEASQLARVFQNLIGNAIKFRREGVRPEVHVTARPEGSDEHFEIVDNGIGIAPEHFEGVFEMFRRLHDRQTYEGTGLGLAICKKIVERHGGRMWVEAAPGGGTAFHFTLRRPAG